jgi:hypothetical protein
MFNFLLLVLLALTIRCSLGASLLSSSADPIVRPPLYTREALGGGDIHELLSV